MGTITIPKQGQFSKLTDAARLAHELMDEFGLDDWQFRWDQAKERHGQCSRRRKVISLSAPLTSLVPFEETEDTIRHEIAHAISDGGHGLAWRKACAQTGARPERCAPHDDGSSAILSKYRGFCPEGHAFYRNRKPKRGSADPATWRRSCNYCYPGRFNADYLIRWELNPDYGC